MCSQSHGKFYQGGVSIVHHDMKDGPGEGRKEGTWGMQSWTSHTEKLNTKKDEKTLEKQTPQRDEIERVAWWLMPEYSPPSSTVSNGGRLRTVRKGVACLRIRGQEHHRVQESRIYAECGTSQRGGHQDEREDERKLETRDLGRAVPAWIEMWNERPKTKVGIRTSQWRGEDRSGVREKTFKQGRSLEQQGEHESGWKIDVDLNANRKGQGIGKQDMTLRHEGTEAERVRRTGAGT
ncbi:hypothetical protein B0H13DRAFT_1921001 [Mycena leptocephala]|nr:hypothetical protein B0H13DRAFT_1921001 [Mycena leptocephala]